MAAYRLKGQGSEIVNFVNSWAKNQSWITKHSSPNGGIKSKENAILIYGSSAENLGYAGILKIIDESEGCFVELDTILGLQKLIRYLLMSIALIIAVYVFLQTIVNMPLDFRRVNVLNVMLFFASYITWNFLFFRLLKTYRKHYEKLRENEISFDYYLHRNFRCEIVSGIDPLVFPRKIYLILQLIYFMGFIFITYKIHFIVAVLFGLVFLVFQMSGNIKKLVKAEPYLYWKSIIVNIANRLSLFSLTVIVLVFFLLVLNSVLINFNSREFTKGAVFGDTIAINFRSHVHERNLDRLEIDNINMLRVIWLKPSKTAIGLLIIMASLLLLVWGSVAWDLLRVMEEWKRIMGSKLDSFVMVPPPIYSVYASKVRMVNVFVLANYVGMIFINFLGMLSSVEWTSYFFTGKGLIFSQSAVLFSWLLTYSFIYPSHFIKYVAHAFMLILTIPVFTISFFSFLWILRMVSFRIMKRTRDVLDKSVKNELVQFVQSVCKKHGLKEPELFGTGGKNIMITVKREIFTQSTAVCIGEDAVEKLTIKELKAAIAHELGHIQHGMRRVEIYKFLSALALIPCSYLSLVLNPSELEFKADEFAVMATGDKDALVNALIKTSIYNIESSPDDLSSKITDRLTRTPLLEWAGALMKRIVEICKFFFGERLLGYAHPPLSIRLAHLNQI